MTFYRGWIVAAIALAAAGCGEGVGEKLAKQCFPADAYRWMAASGPGDSVRQNAPRVSTAAKSATIYVDRSGSMAGYLEGATNLERPLQDLIATLPATLRLADLKAEVRSFGATISEPLAYQGKVLETAEGFRCKASDPASCDNKETHLDKVFARVSEKPDELAIIVSDLWFTNSQVNSSGVAALQPILTDILHSDRAIAIYGIESPFNGKIFDLPRAGSGMVSTDYQGRHPFYMVVIGPKFDVVAFDSLLPKSGSKFIADGKQNGNISRSLFAVDPGPEGREEKAPLSKPRHPRLSIDPFAIPAGVTVQRFAMEGGLPDLSQAKAKMKLPTWIGPKESFFLPDAVWRGDTVNATRIWQQVDDNCSQTSWLEMSPGALGWSEVTNGQSTFVFDPDVFSGTLAREGKYLIVGETQRSSLAQPNPANEWMRGKWNLEPKGAEAIAARSPAVFPTLNLSEFARIMEGALAEAAQRRKQPIAGFTFMVRVDD